MSLWDRIKQQGLSFGWHPERAGSAMADLQRYGMQAFQFVTDGGSVEGPQAQPPKLTPTQVQNYQSAGLPVPIQTGFSDEQVKAQTAMRAAWTYGVSRPLTTAMFYADPFDPLGNNMSLRDNWNQSEYVSPGQEIVAGFNNYFGDDAQVGPFAGDGSNANTPRDQVNRWIEQRTSGQRFTGNEWANLVSGAGDAVFNWMLDPTVIAGRGLGAARDANLTRTATAKRAPNLVAEIDDEAGGMAAAVQRLADYETYAQVMNDPIVGKSTQMGDALWLAKQAAGEDGAYGNVALTMKAALGDKAAKAELRTQSVGIADLLDTLDNGGAWVEQVPLDYVDWMRDQNKWLDAALGRDGNTGVQDSLIGRPTASKYESLERWRGRGTVRAGDLDVKVFQETPLSRPVVVVHSWGQTRPAGAIPTAGIATDAYTEIQSYLYQAKAMTPGQRNELLNTWAEATTREEKVQAARSIRYQTVRNVVEEHGLTGEAADMVTNRLIGITDDGAQEATRTGYLVDSQGRVVHDAQLVSQLRDGVPLVDLRTLYETLPHIQAVKDMRLGLRSATDQYTSMVNSLTDQLNWAQDTFWKPFVLIRGGYTIRNVTEGLARVAASGDLIPILREQLPSGVADWTRNRAAGSAAVSQWLRGVSDEAPEVGAVGRRVAEPAGTGRRPVVLDDGTTAPGAFQGAAGREAAEASSADSTLQKTFTTTQGRTARRDMQDVVEGRRVSPQSEWGFVKPPAAEAPIAQVEQYWDSYARVVNNQLGNDPIARLLIGGMSADEVVSWLRRPEQRALRQEYGLTRATAQDHVVELNGYINSLIPDDLGRVMRKQQAGTLPQGVPAPPPGTALPDVPWQGNRPATGSRQVVAIQSGENTLRQKVLDGGLSWQEYADLLDADAIGPILGERIAGLTVNAPTIASRASKAKNTLFKWVGSLPETTLVRHPFYNQSYKSYYQAMYQRAVDQGIEVTDDVVRGFAYQARRNALRDLKSTLYTIDRYSNIAASLRLFSPFIAATNNTILAWGRIIRKNPQTIAHMAQLWNAPVRLGIVYDENGVQIPSDTAGIPLSSKYRVLIPIPDAVKKKFGLPEGYELMPSLSSFNVAIQSDPWWAPSWGPFVSVPVNMAVNANPDDPLLNAVAGLVSPREGDITQAQAAGNPIIAALPTQMRLWFQKNDKEGRVRAQVTAEMWAAAFKKADAAGVPRSSINPNDIEKQVDGYFYLRMLGSATLPFATTIRDPEVQLYLNKAREYNQQGIVNGETPGERFLRDFPDWYEYTFSVSRNDTRASADADVKRRIDYYSKGDTNYVDKVGALDPALVGVLVNNPDGKYSFSSPVYNWQYGRSIGPSAVDSEGRPVTFRDGQSGKAAVDEVEVSRGWTEYLAERRNLDSYMRANGITSLRDRPGVQAAWREFVAKQQEKYPAWAKEYQQRDDGKYARNAQGLAVIVGQERWQKENPGTYAVLSDYLAERQKLLTYLASVGSSASSLRSGGRDNLRQAWFAYVNDLMGRDTRFQQVYTQFLDGEFGRMEDQTGGGQ